jgi:hypothetical protein
MRGGSSPEPVPVTFELSADGVAFHFMQSGGAFIKRNGRLLGGRTWDEMPAIPTEIFASNPASALSLSH